MLTNLLDNAARHARPPSGQRLSIAIVVERSVDGAKP